MGEDVYLSRLKKGQPGVVHGAPVAMYGAEGAVYIWTLKGNLAVLWKLFDFYLRWFLAWLCMYPVFNSDL